MRPNSNDSGSVNVDALQLKAATETALTRAGFAVAEDDTQLPNSMPPPGGACVYIENDKVVLYLTDPQADNGKHAEIAAYALAKARLRMIQEGGDPETDRIRTVNVLLVGAGEVLRGSRGPFSENWKDQYDRMRRSHVTLTLAANLSNAGSHEARDALYHFFQDAFHLKDWIINSIGFTPAEKNALEDHITATPALALCADICIGIKHLNVDKPRDRKAPAELTNQSVHIMMGTGADHIWHLTYDSQKINVLDTAADVLAKWDAWLNDEGLLTS